MTDNVKVVRALLRGWHRLGAVSPLIGRHCGLAPPTCGPASGHVGGSRSPAGRRAGRARSAAEWSTCLHVMKLHLLRCSTTNTDGGRKKKEDETK